MDFSFEKKYFQNKKKRSILLKFLRRMLARVGGVAAAQRGDDAGAPLSHGAPRSETRRTRGAPLQRQRRAATASTPLFYRFFIDLTGFSFISVVPFCFVPI